MPKVALPVGDQPLDLPRFQKALRPYATELPINTFYRYASGMLPAALRFIIERPELAEALAADARALAAQTVSESVAA